MTPEMEAKLFENLGSINTGIANLNSLLDSHTSQDMEQFKQMTETIKALDTKLDNLIAEKVDKVINDLAVASAVKQEQDKNIKKIATVRAAWVGGVITVLSTIAQIFVPMFFKK